MSWEYLHAIPISPDVIYKKNRPFTTLQHRAWLDTVRRMKKSGAQNPATAIITKDSVSVTFFSIFTVVIDRNCTRSFMRSLGEETESFVADDVLLMHPFSAARKLVHELIYYIAHESDAVIANYYDEYKDDFDMEEHDPEALCKALFFDPYQHFDRSLFRFQLVRSLRDFQNQLFDRLPWLCDHKVKKLAERIWNKVNTSRYVSVYRNRENLNTLAEKHGNLLPLLSLVKPDCFSKTDLFDSKYWTNGNTEIFIPGPFSVQKPWQTLPKHTWKQLKKLPEEIVRELTVHNFGAEYDYQAFFRVCNNSSEARSALTLFKGLCGSFHLCWMVPEKRKLYTRDKHPSWNDALMFLFMKRLRHCAEEYPKTDEHSVCREMYDILDYVGSQHSDIAKKPIEWKQLSKEAREWKRRFWRRENIINDYEVWNSLNCDEWYPSSSLWWKRVLPQSMTIRGCAVSECQTQIDLARIYLESGLFWPPDKERILPAVAGKRIYVEVRSENNPPELLIFDAITNGFILTEKPSSPLLLEIGEMLEDFLFQKNFSESHAKFSRKKKSY